MKKGVSVFFLVLILIFSLLSISACKRQVGDYPITDKDYKKGINGLDIEFIQNAPPAKMYEKSVFKVIPRVYNKGAYDTDNVLLTIGLEEDYMCVADASSSSGESEDKCLRFGEEDKTAIQELSSKKEELATEKARLSGLQAQYEDLANKNDEQASYLIDEIAKSNEKIESIDGTLQTMIASTKDIIKRYENYFTKNFTLDGKNIYNPNGEIKEAAFDIYSRNIDPQSRIHTSTITMTACYEYYTEFTEDVCIDPDIYGTSAISKVCTAGDILKLGGEGAPVIIDKVEVKMLPTDGGKVRPQFIIHIKNSGNGEVISADKIKDACSATGLTRVDWNAVELSSLKIGYNDYGYEYASGTIDPANTKLNAGTGLGEFECTRQPAKLYNKEGEIRCTLKDGHALDKAAISAFKTQLYIKLRYGYTFSESKDVVVEKTIT